MILKMLLKFILVIKESTQVQNAAHTEAVCAGALNIMLCGDAFYFGKIVKKDKIGDDVRPVEIEDIIRVNHLLYGTVILFFLAVIILRLGVNLYGKV